MQNMDGFHFSKILYNLNYLDFLLCLISLQCYQDARIAFQLAFLILRHILRCENVVAIFYVNPYY